MKILKKMMLVGLLTPLIILVGPRADAAMLFTFQRISDNEAIVAASGMPATGFPTGTNIGRFNRLVFENLVEGFSGGAAVAGQFEIGSTTLTGFAAVSPDLINEGALFFDDSVPRVSAILTLGGSVEWAPIGASNRILSNYIAQSSASTDQSNVQVGTWEMIAPVPQIPLPGAFGLLASSLALGSFVAFRHRATAQR